MKLRALFHAGIASMLLTAALTVWGELSAGFKTLLTGVTGHHWVTKGVISLVVLAGVYALLSLVYDERFNAEKETRNVLLSAVLAGIVISGFFVWHFLSA